VYEALSYTEHTLTNTKSESMLADGLLMDWLFLPCAGVCWRMLAYADVC
jgi:hypothetical protein